MADEHAHHRAIIGVGHRAARHGDTELEHGGDRDVRRTRRAARPILPATGLRALDAATAREVDLPAGTPVVAGAADGPCGNLGTGAIAPGSRGCRSARAAQPG